MAENEAMEGKDFAREEKIKEQFEEMIMDIVNNMEEKEATINSSIEGISITIEELEDGKYKINLMGEKIGTATKNRGISYNIEGLKNVEKKLENNGRPIARYEDLGLPDIEYLKQLEKDKNEKDDNIKKDDEVAKDEEEKDDEKPELDSEDKAIDEEKEEIAKEYNVNSNQVIHIANDEKVTEDHRFDGFARWAEGYDDVFIIQGEDKYSWKFVGSRDGEKEEIENENIQIGGKNPDINIKRMDENGNITEVRPLAMYETDSETAIAIARDEHGRLEALACRQEGGDEKTYWGSIIPEASGKNVEQSPMEVRQIISSNKNSSLDLSRKGNELEYIKDLKERNAPIELKVDNIDGNHTQIKTIAVEKIAEDLMKRDGIIDRATVPPGFYENKANKVLQLMEKNETMDYEEAIERVENVNKRENGGRTPDQKRNREG